MRKIHTLPSIPLDIEDTPHNLRLTNAAVKLIEEKSSKPITELGNNTTLNDITIMIWACLIHEDPELKIEHIAGLIGPANMEYVIGQLTQTITIHGIEAEGKNPASPTG